VADVPVPGALHLAFLRSPYAHARIVNFEAGEAARAPGVVRVLSGAELSALVPSLPVLWPCGDPKTRTRPLAAADVVRYVGEPVAVVAATSRYAAEDALELIEIEYDPLPVAASVEGALADGAPLLFPAWGDNVVGTIVMGAPPGGPATAATRRMGEDAATADGMTVGADAAPADGMTVGADAAPVGGASAEADTAATGGDFGGVVVRERFSVARLAGAPMEVRGAVAQYDPASGEMTLWASTQVATPLRMVTAEALGMPQAKLRVIAPDVGGGFGNKDAPQAEEVLTALMAKITGRTVKWIEDRHEAMLAMTQARGQTHDIELAVNDEGLIQSLTDEVLVDAGAHLASVGLGPGFVTAAMLPGPYHVPQLYARVRGVVTNKTPFGAYRGFGMPEATYALERALDQAARRLGMDPAELRRRNLIRPEEMPFTTPTRLEYDSGDYPAALQTALDRIGYTVFRAEQSRGREAGRLLGIGVVPYLEFTGQGPSPMQKFSGSPSGGYEEAVVRMDREGGVTVYTGMASIGTGIKTTMAQVAAAELGIEPEHVTVIVGDTQICPPSPLGTVSSRSAPVGNAAVRLAARKVRGKLLELAAHLLEAAPEDLSLAGERAFVSGSPERGLALPELARAAHQAFDLPRGMEPGLLEHAGFDPVHVTFSYGVHAATVEVDRLTGEASLLRYVVVHDCGPLVNPTIVEGQIWGGVAQGLGAALLEELRFDEGGQPLTTSLMDYMLPVTTSMPEIEIVHTETPSPFTPDGAKGCGESGTIPSAPVIVAAIEDALEPFGATLRSIPVTPEMIWQAIGA
jgi:aerobic carbon-monoxide dehydrogenase large subunit